MTGVLVVDDSQFIRTVVGNALTDAGYDVATVSSGEDAIAFVEANEPDVITMDVEMPGMSGIDAVEHIMCRRPTPILMLSAYTERGTEATLDALERGALDVLQKPDGSGGTNIGHLTDAVVEKVEELSEASISTLALARATAAVSATERRQVTPSGGGSTVTDDGGVQTISSRRQADTPTIDTATLVDDTVLENPTVIIGASTGGPRIIEQILTHLPADLEAKVLIVQHMPVDFTRRLADRLDAISAYDVAEARDGDRVRAGEVLIAKGGSHLQVVNNVNGALRVRLDDGERIHGVRPAIDVTMETAAARVSDPLCGVVLTGMGRDGAAGIRAIKRAGGYTIAQDEATSPVFGIPQQAIETGCVDEVVPAPAIIDRLIDVFTMDGETDD